VYLTEVVSKNKNWDTGVEKMIKENMIVGNYEGAIDCALKCGRVPEALLIAYS
jgi:protein transport protein SEC31